MIGNLTAKSLATMAITLIFVGLLLRQIIYLDDRIKKLEASIAIGNGSPVKQMDSPLRKEIPATQLLLPSSSSADTSVRVLDGAVVVGKRESMNEIGSRTKTDKVYQHRYNRYYPRFVEQLRHVPSMKMLEIGFLFGQSFAMWKEYFPNGKVYFMDIVKSDTFPENRFTGDSGNVNSLSTLLDDKKVRGDLDLIVDDGSHLPEHQVTAFEYLFLHGLKPGGIYIVEDIETSYWQSGECYGYPMRYGIDHPNSLMNKMKPMVDVANRKFTLPNKRVRSTFKKEIDEWVSGIFFGMNNVIIVKATKDEYDFMNANDYPWVEHLSPEQK